MAKNDPIGVAKFDPKIKTYEYLGGFIPLVLSFIGIPLTPIWFFLGRKYAERHYRALSCTLTEKSLCVKKGVWFRTEKTIPLEKITDLAVKEGPLLRYFGLCTLKIETAGASAEGQANADMTGVVDALGFRDMVLNQRDILEERKFQSVAPTPAPPPAPAVGDATLVAMVSDIRDALLRIEERLEPSQSSDE